MWVRLLLFVFTLGCFTAYGPCFAQGGQERPRRMAILVLATSDQDQNLADNLTEVLIAAIAEQTGAFIVGKDEFEAILETEGAQSFRCLESPACLGRAGVSLGVTEVISGVVGSREGGFALSLVRTDVATGNVISRQFVEVDGSIGELVAAAQGAAEPLLSGDETPREEQPVEEQPDVSSPRGRLSRRVTGLFAELGFGANGLTDDDYVMDALDIRPLVGLQLTIGYRPIPYLSAGALIQYSFFVADGEDVDEERSGMLVAAATVRGHIPAGRVDPWIGVGFGYAMTHSSGEGRWWISQGDLKLRLHGMALAVEGGVSVFVTERLSLGAVFRFTAGFWTKACWDVEGHIVGGRVDEADCDDVDSFYEDGLTPGSPQPDLPHLWYAGLTVSYILL